MTTDEYQKVLLDSSFKEANLFWVRNGAFLVCQTLLYGFVVSILVKTNYLEYKRMLIFIEIAGLVISMLHFIILALSRSYNYIWFNELVKITSTEIEFNKDNNKNNNANNRSLLCILRKYEHSNRIINVFSITMLIALIPFIAWAILLSVT